MRFLIICFCLISCFVQPASAQKHRNWAILKENVSRSFKFRHVLRRQRVMEYAGATSAVPPNTHFWLNTRPLPLVYVDQNKKIERVQPFSICSKKLFGVIRMDKQTPVVDFWTLTSPPVTEMRYGPSSNDQAPVQWDCLSQTTPIGTTTEQLDGKTVVKDYRFELDLGRSTLGQSTNLVRVPFRTFAFGISTIPVRIRKGLPSPATGQVNASVFGGFVWGNSRITHRGINNWAWTVGPFVGLSLVELKKPQYKNQGVYVVDQTLPAVSYGVSFIRSFNKIGFTLSFGTDRATGGNAKEWLYQNKLWYGIGVSTSFDVGG